MSINFEMEEDKINEISDLVMKIFDKDERGRHRGLGVGNHNGIFYIFPILNMFAPMHPIRALQARLDPNSINDDEIYNPIITIDLNNNEIYDSYRRFPKECSDFISAYDKEFGIRLEIGGSVF